jgi:hypothetical protein
MHRAASLLTGEIMTLIFALSMLNLCGRKHSQRDKINHSLKVFSAFMKYGNRTYRVPEHMVLQNAIQSSLTEVHIIGSCRIPDHSTDP